MKQFFNLYALTSKRFVWVVGLLLLVGQTVGAFAPDNKPPGSSPAPQALALGDKIFLDYNRNGLQDAGEPGVPNIRVRLYQSGIKRDSALTNSNGQYAFTTGLQANTPYEIRVLVADYPTGLTLSKPNQGNDDNVDSDAQMVGNQAVIFLTTGSDNAPNDSYDIGFATPDPDLVITKSANSGQVVKGNNATFTIRVDNTSTGSAANVIVKDTLDAGMAYISSSPAATVSTTPSSQTVLTWNLGTVAGGGSSTMSLIVKTLTEGVLYNTAYVTTSDPESMTKNNVSRACVTVPIKLCPGDGFVASLPGQYTNVTWYKDGNTTPVASGNSFTITQAGSYSFTTTANTDCPANGCCPIIVEDGIVPNLAITPAAPAICAGATTSLTATGCGNGTLLWSTGETTTSILVSPASTAVYSVTCSPAATSYGVCSAFASTTVTVNPNPVITLTSATVCAGQTASLTATAGYASYVFSSGLTQVGSSNVATLVGTGATTTAYSVTATSSEGCSSTATGSVTVNPNPVITLTSATVCAGQTASLTATAGYASYVFSSGLTQVGSSNVATLVGTGATTTAYSVTATSSEGCSSTATGSVTVNPNPVITLTSATVCAGQTASLTATAGYASYVFSSGLTQVGSSNVATLVGTGATTTAYSVTATSSEGCSSTATGSVTVNPNPVITLTSATVCAGQTASLTATAGYASYVFSSGLTQVGSSNVATLVGTGATTTAYSVTATSSEGCSSTATGSVTVNPNPVITLTSATVCAGQMASLTATAGYASYQFSSGLTQVGSSNVATLVGTGATTTAYSVTATSSEGCSSTATGSVTVNALPTPGIVASSLTICQGESSTLTASGGTTYKWSTGEQTASIVVTTSGVYSVTVGNQSGCLNVTQETITVNPRPVLTATPSLTIFQGETKTLTISGCEGGTLVWSTGDNTASLLVKPLVTTTYSATCTFSTGCSSTTATTITVNEAPTYDVTPVTISASCNGGNARNDGQIVLTMLKNTERVDVVMGSSYGSGPAYGDATNKLVTVTNGKGSVTLTNLPNPSTAQPYTVRLFSTGGTYYVDVTVTLNPAECICPAPKCVPVVIQKIR